MSSAGHVFISHAGEDKAGISIPLYEALAQLSIPSFIDKLSLSCGNHSDPHSDSFSPQCLVLKLSPDVFLDFNTRNRGEYSTAEGKLKARPLSITSQPSNTAATAVGRVSPRAPGAIGMGGVGKLTALIGISWEPDVREIQYIPMALISFPRALMQMRTTCNERFHAQ